MKNELNVAHVASTENDSNTPFNLENIGGSRFAQSPEATFTLLWFIAKKWWKNCEEGNKVWLGLMKNCNLFELYSRQSCFANKWDAFEVQRVSRILNSNLSFDSGWYCIGLYIWIEKYNRPPLFDHFWNVTGQVCGHKKFFTLKPQTSELLHTSDPREFQKRTRLTKNRNN